MKISIWKQVLFTALAAGIPLHASADVGHRVSFFEGQQPGAKAGKQIVRVGLVNQDNFDDYALVGHKQIDIISGRNKAVLGSIGIPRLSQGRAFAAPLYDVDNDGNIEIAVGFPREQRNGNLGLVEIYEIDKRTRNITHERTLKRRADRTQASEELGTKVKLLPAQGGDIDGDGWRDIITSAPFTKKDGLEKGSLTIFSSRTGDELFSLYGRHTGDRFGHDFDTCNGLHWRSTGAGIPNIVVGAPGPSDASSGRVEVYLLGNTAYNSELLFEFAGNTSKFRSATIGEQVGCAGKISSPLVGYDDGFIVSTNKETGAQSLNLFHYDERGHGKVFARKAYGTDPIVVAKTSVRGFRELTGDYQHDLVVAEPHYSHGRYSQAGRVQVLDGSDSSLNTVAYTRFGWQENLHLGAALDYASDLNGDGANDIAVGAATFTPGKDGKERNRGRAYILSATPLPAPEVSEITGLRTDFDDFEINIQVDHGIRWSGRAGRPGDTVQLLFGTTENGRFVYSERLDAHILLERRDGVFDAVNIGSTKVRQDGTFSGFIPLTQNFSFVGIEAHFQAVVVRGLQASKGLTATSGHGF